MLRYSDKFIIKEISPSRKEVRLKLVNNDITREGITGDGFLSDFETKAFVFHKNNIT